MNQPAKQVIPMPQPARQLTTPQYPLQLNDHVMVISEDDAKRHRLNKLLNGAGYRATFTDDNRRALDAIQQAGIQLIIADAQMPEVCSLELCHRLHDEAKYQRPYVMLLTDNTTKLDVVAAVHAGVDDVLFAPLSDEELQVRLLNAIRVLRLRNQTEHHSLQLADALNREAVSRKIIHHGLRAAARAQRDLLVDDDSPFPQLEIRSLFLPAGMVASDSFNCFKLDDDHLGFYMLDTTGNELASVMLSFTVSRALSRLDDGIVLRQTTDDDTATVNRYLPAHIVPPDQVVSALNIRFAEQDTGVDYFTMIYGVIDIHTGAGELCQAGHPHPIVIAGESRIMPFGNGGFAVGLVNDASYDTIRFQLEPGDRLFMYSDGLTDCRTKAGGCFSIQRLASLLEKTRGRSLAKSFDKLAEQLGHWQKSKPIGDDISLLAIGRVGRS